MNFFFKSIENKPYIFSRFISVSIKPLMLFVSLALGYKEFGAVIAMVFLVSSVNMMLCSVPIFRDFFINFNNKSPLKKNYFKQKYKSQIVILFLITIIFTIPINQFFENSIEIFICSVLIFSVDKIYDEIQRVLILKKDFNAWSNITNLKNITLVIFLLNPIVNISIIYLGITYFLINFSKQYTYINLSFNFNLKKEIKKFSSSIWKNKKIYIMNYFLLFYTIGDKIVIGKSFKENLVEYIFLSNILSVPLLFILFFYISKYRAEFVNNLISLKDVIYSKRFNYLLISTFSLVFVIILFYLNLNFSKFSLVSIIILLLIYFIKAYSLILDEIVYWKSFYKDFLFFEFLFFILFVIVILLTSYLDLTLDIFLPMLLILFFVKFIFKMIIFINKS
tara:strand:+ start:2423 stop:3601 length:1179 start_codon:yes stop_codon:yes gene_type:complete